PSPNPSSAYPAPPVAQGPKKRSRWPLWVGLIVGIVLVIVLACCGGSYALYQTTLAPAVGSGTTVATFCVGEESQNYTSAYGELSHNLQSQISLATFTTDNQQFDSTKGPVTNCQVNSRGASSASGSRYTFTLDVTRDSTNSSNYSGSITVIKDGNNWRIDQIDPALPVT
ncbi:MAG: hypothetical protein ABI068_06490, partial [Ktedonobacterales bacterium]